VEKYKKIQGITILVHYVTFRFQYGKLHGMTKHANKIDINAVNDVFSQKFTSSFIALQ
jgi:hypothetical protein